MTRQAQELRDMALLCDGVEVHKDHWRYAEEVIFDDPAFKLSAAHGPGREWKRLTEPM